MCRRRCVASNKADYSDRNFIRRYGFGGRTTIRSGRSRRGILRVSSSRPNDGRCTRGVVDVGRGRCESAKRNTRTGLSVFGGGTGVSATTDRGMSGTGERRNNNDNRARERATTIMTSRRRDGKVPRGEREIIINGAGRGTARGLVGDHRTRGRRSSAARRVRRPIDGGHGAGRLFPRPTDATGSGHFSRPPPTARRRFFAARRRFDSRASTPYGVLRHSIDAEKTFSLYRRVAQRSIFRQVRDERVTTIRPVPKHALRSSSPSPPLAWFALGVVLYTLQTPRFRPTIRL